MTPKGPARSAQSPSLQSSYLIGDVMWNLLTGLVTGGASLLGNIFSSQTSAENTQAQMQAQQAMQAQSEQFNASQAQMNRDFQASQVSQAEAYNTQMSNTAYQRASADMTKAGLNPMMMFGSGSAASTPSSPVASGSSASIGTPSVPMSQRTSPLAGLGDVVQKGLSAAVTSKTIDKLTEDIANAHVENAKIIADTGLAQNRVAQVRQETLTEEERTKLAALHINPALVSATEANQIIGLARDHPDFFGAINKSAYIGGKASKTIEPATDLISSARGVQRLFQDRWNDMYH